MLENLDVSPDMAAVEMPPICEALNRASASVLMDTKLVPLIALT